MRGDAFDDDTCLVLGVVQLFDRGSVLRVRLLRCIEVLRLEIEIYSNFFYYIVILKSMKASDSLDRLFKLSDMRRGLYMNVYTVGLINESYFHYVIHTIKESEFIMNIKKIFSYNDESFKNNLYYTGFL